MPRGDYQHRTLSKPNKYLVRKMSSDYRYMTQELIIKSYKDISEIFSKPRCIQIKMDVCIKHFSKGNKKIVNKVSKYN